VPALLLFLFTGEKSQAAYFTQTLTCARECTILLNSIPTLSLPDAKLTAEERPGVGGQGGGELQVRKPLDSSNSVSDVSQALSYLNKNSSYFCCPSISGRPLSLLTPADCA